mgnify:CR=1 FL=1
MDVNMEIDELRRELEYHSKLYYVMDAPVISDFEYDMMLRRLEDLEADAVSHDQVRTCPHRPVERSEPRPHRVPGPTRLLVKQVMPKGYNTL